MEKRDCFECSDRTCLRRGVKDHERRQPACFKGEQSQQNERADESDLKRIVSWVDVNDRLPFKDLNKEEKDVVYGEFLVCVEPDNFSEGDSREITILEFYGVNDEWRSDTCTPYNWCWHVTHWAELPLDPFN